MSMKNDISFLIDAGCLYMSTSPPTGPNLPLRFLFYLSDLYSGMTRGCQPVRDEEGTDPAAPGLLSFTRGRGPAGPADFKLSDLYTVKEEEHKLELEALMLNVNTGHNEELLNACRTLGEYAAYTGRVRRYARRCRLKKRWSRRLQSASGRDSERLPGEDRREAIR